MYKYSDSFDNNGISLHDCLAVRAELDGDTLSFIFKDGIYIVGNSRHNSSGRLMYTDTAELRITLLRTFRDVNWDAAVYIFTEENGRTYRETVKLTELIDMINGGAELEFLYSYRGYRSMLFECWLCFDEEPYHKECVITVQSDKAECLWNEMFEEQA